jgi:hypothetical protein
LQADFDTTITSPAISARQDADLYPAIEKMFGERHDNRRLACTACDHIADHHNWDANVYRPENAEAVKLPAQAHEQPEDKGCGPQQACGDSFSRPYALQRPFGMLAAGR